MCRLQFHVFSTSISATLILLMFGYSIPRQEVVPHEGAVAVNVRALDGLLTPTCRIH